MATTKIEQDRKRKLRKRMRDLTALRYHAVLSWIWGVAMQFGAKSEPGSAALKLHSAMASIRAVMSYDDLRGKLAELVREALERQQKEQ
jgi:hypothetical protein